MLEQVLSYGRVLCIIKCACKQRQALCVLREVFVWQVISEQSAPLIPEGLTDRRSNCLAPELPTLCQETITNPFLEAGRQSQCVDQMPVEQPATTVEAIRWYAQWPTRNPI